MTNEHNTKSFIPYYQVLGRERRPVSHGWDPKSIIVGFTSLMVPDVQRPLPSL